MEASSGSRCSVRGERHERRHASRRWQGTSSSDAARVRKFDASVSQFGTAKVNAALKRGVFVVTPNWLIEAALLWRRPTEEFFLWKRDAEALAGPTSLPTSVMDEEEEEHDVDMDLDWKKVNEEVMAGGEDTDDDLSEADIADVNGLNAGKKRGRTSTASTDGDVDTSKDPQGESPLSKRQRLARSRSSKLKISSGSVDQDAEEDAGIATPDVSALQAGLDGGSQTGSSDDLDLDALASELWG